MILKILDEDYGLGQKTLLPLEKGISQSYKTTDNRYFIKVIDACFHETLFTSLILLDKLNQDKFPSPKLVRTKNGDLFKRLNDKVMVVFDYLDGQQVDAPDYKRLGILVGSMHQILRDVPLMTRDKSYYFGRYINYLKQKNYPAVDLYQNLADQVWSRVKDLPIGFCHGDLHLGNILEKEAYYILDFDTSSRSFPMYDIMMICNRTNYFILNQSDFKDTLRAYQDFIQSYKRVCPLSDYEVNAFYDLVMMYHYQLQATILDIHGVDCIDHDFIDKQWQWLLDWQAMVKLL